MTTELHAAINNLIQSLDESTFGRKSLTEANLKALKEAYSRHMESLTDTQSRVEFLRKCLESGMSKREAARELCKSDPRLSPRSAETIVYITFSGMYQTSRRGRKLKKREAVVSVPKVETPRSVTDDEAML